MLSGFIAEHSTDDSQRQCSLWLPGDVASEVLRDPGLLRFPALS